MMPETAPFDSPAHLHAAFSDGLHRLLAQDGSLGAFILVLANVHADLAGFADLRAGLDRRYHELVAQCRRQLIAGASIAAPADDVLVLLKLMAMGYEQLPAPQQRQLGPWQVQFNLLRSLRPERAGGERIEQLLRPFNGDCFNFNKPFLSAETLWRGDFLGRSVVLLYNKFPFMPLHGLWVPDPQHGLPQYLLSDLHHYIWSCCQHLAERIPGIGFGYNSLGAGASVNHLHFQLFVAADLPVEAEAWCHASGSQAYPVQCQRFDDVDLAWSAIEHCHRQNIAYNILYRGSHAYLIQRRLQGQFERRPWLSGLGWSELCGRFVLFNQAHFHSLDAVEVDAQLQALNR